MNDNILIPKMELLLLKQQSILLKKDEISEMCSFVQAALEEKHLIDNKSLFLSKQNEYKKLKRLRSKENKQKLIFLNLLLELNGCYNEYNNIKFTKSKKGLIERSLYNSIEALQEFIQKNNYTDMSEDVAIWFVCNQLNKLFTTKNNYKRYLSDIVILVKMFDIEGCPINNQIDRFFYDCKKYKDKIIYMVPIIKSGKGKGDEILDEIINTYTQRLKSIEKTRNYKQTLFCHPLIISKCPSVQLVKKVW